MVEVRWYFVWQFLTGQRPQGVKVAPQGAAHEAHALQGQHLAVQPGDLQALTGRLQSQVGFVPVQVVVLMVAGHKQHGRGPALQG